MNVIVIGKPRIDVTEIVDNFPLEGKDKKITKRIPKRIPKKIPKRI